MRRNRSGLTLVEALIGVAILVIVIGLLMPFSRSAREPARRNSCLNNLKQISLALLNYESEHGTLPPAYTVDAEGNRLHSWRTLILPYIYEQAIFDDIDFTKPWDDPVNAKARESAVPAYLCPSYPGEEDTLTTYLAVVGSKSAFPGSIPRRLSEISDGEANTIMIVDINYKRAVHWMSPEDITPEELLADLQKERPKVAWQHGKLFQAAFLDGHVSTLALDVDRDVLRGQLTIAGGEKFED